MNQAIHLISQPGEIYKTIDVQIEQQPEPPLWRIINSQVKRYQIQRICPYCHGQYIDSDHTPAARVDCLHRLGDHSWWTTDICCHACLESHGLTTVIEVYLSQCGDIVLVERDWTTGTVQLLN